MFNDLTYHNDSIANIPGTPIHIYSILMAVAFLVATLASWIKLYRRNIPTKTLEWSMLVIAIAGLIGARVWFVINNTSTITTFVDMISIWNGGMAIEGGVMVAMVVGFLIFYGTSKQLQISMWVYIDCIVPNILLGQAIGRWGNFFNQELLGANTGHPFTWLPTWINDHLHYLNEGHGVGIYRQPLFLYESMASLVGWLILTIFIPKIGQMVSKKPWKLFPQTYISPKTTNPIKLKDVLLPWKAIKKWWKYYHFKKQTWKQAYFDFIPERLVTKSFVKKPWKTIKVNGSNQLSFKDKIKNQYLKLKYNMQPHCKPLINLYNPHHYRITAAGVSGASYFIFYGIIRMILEPLRDSRDIMMIGNISTSMVLSGLWIIFGCILAIFAQFIAPSRLRKGEWLYEKSY